MIKKGGTAAVLIVHAHNGVPIRLTEERWQHVRHRHPDMETQRERVLETLVEPDMIQRFWDMTRGPPVSRDSIDQEISRGGLSGNQFRRRLCPDSISRQSALSPERHAMEAISILEKPTAITWDYDEDADVLYLSLRACLKSIRQQAV